jgi:ABC-type uncharacterized transport system permease subunit
MWLWWIGNVLLLLVVVPVLVALLNRVLAALERIRGAADDILAGGTALVGELDAVPTLLVTLVITFLIIAAAALGLLRVIFHLMAARKSLAGVVVGVQLVAEKTRTVPEVVSSVNANLKPVRDFCESI